MENLKRNLNGKISFTCNSGRIDVNIILMQFVVIIFLLKSKSHTELNPYCDSMKKKIFTCESKLQVVV